MPLIHKKLWHQCLLTANVFGPIGISPLHAECPNVSFLTVLMLDLQTHDQKRLALYFEDVEEASLEIRTVRSISSNFEHFSQSCVCTSCGLRG